MSTFNLWNGLDANDALSLLKRLSLMFHSSLFGSNESNLKLVCGLLTRLHLDLHSIKLPLRDLQISLDLRDDLNPVMSCFEEWLLDDVEKYALTKGLQSASPEKHMVLYVKDLISKNESDKCLQQFINLELLRIQPLREVVNKIDRLLTRLKTFPRWIAGPGSPISAEEHQSLSPDDRMESVRKNSARNWTLLFRHLSRHNFECGDPSASSSSARHETRICIGDLNLESKGLLILCSTCGHGHCQRQYWHPIDLQPEVPPPLTRSGTSRRSNGESKVGETNIEWCIHLNKQVLKPFNHPIKVLFDSHKAWKSEGRGRRLKQHWRNPSLEPLHLVFTTSSLSEKARKGIQCTLARSVWYLFDTPWIPKVWALDSVWLIEEEQRPQHWPDTPDVDCVLSPSMGHDCSDPAVNAILMLRFCLLMLRIEYPQFQSTLLAVPNERNLDAEQLDAKLEEIIEGLTSEVKISETLDNIVDFCLNWDDGQDSEPRQILNRIVRPLEADFYRSSGKAPPIIRSDLGTSGNSASHGHSAAATRQRTDSKIEDKPRQKERVVYYDCESEDHSDRKIRYATEFFTRLDNFRANFIETHRIKKRVRIAVLDTGVNPSQLRGLIDKIVAQRSRMVKDSQDSNPLKGVTSFGHNDTKKGEDTDGHGTDVMRLLLKVAPEADYYIAKISRTKQDKDENATKNIISALEWAMEEEVDLINMSFGLSTEDVDPDLRHKLVEASGKHIKLFAAAGNHGRNDSRAFPANMYCVTCVHAAKGSGASAEDINPGYEEYPDRWQTLGVAVELGVKKYMSGTSFATPICVGIVANAFDAVRIYQSKHLLSDKRASFLETFDGVMYLLGLMSKDGFIAPWILWREDRLESRVAERL